MKGLFFLILLLFPVVFLLHGQKTNLLWVKQINGTPASNARGLSIATDAAGNVYTTGFFSGHVDFDPGPGVHMLNPRGIEDAFVCKLDSSGQFQWVKQTDAGNGTNYVDGRSVAVDTGGNVLITGNFSQDIGIGTCYVTKFNAAGNLIWTKELGRSSTGISIKVDALKNVYIAGRFSGEGDFDPGPGNFDLEGQFFFCKLDENGNLGWARAIGERYAIAQGNVSITLDGIGNVYGVCGMFGIGPLGFTDIFVVKLGRQGELAWIKQMGGVDEDIGVSIVADDPGNLYISGNFKGSADFDPGPGTYNLVIKDSVSNGFISKLDPNGNFVWAKHLNGSWQWCYSNALDGNGNIYTVGYFGNTVDFDPGPGEYNLSTSAFDIYVSKLNSNGDFVWTKQMGGTARVICNDITVDTAGIIYTTGYFFNGNVDFDPGPENFYLDSGTDENLFVHKMGQCRGSTSSFITVSACGSYSLNGVTYDSSGLYTQYLTNTGGCDSILTLELLINKVHKTIDVTTCDNYTMNNHTYYANGTYTDTLITSNGCDSIVTLNLAIMPPLVTTVTQSICVGGSFNGYSTAGMYYDTLVARNGCDSIVALQLTVLNGPSPALGADTTLCPGDSLRLYPGSFTSYRWQDGSAGDHLTINKPGVYSVVVTDSCGSGSDEIIVTARQVCDVYFPKAFTPNNDGLNDNFRILGANNITEFRLIVYNRWGQKVFESFDYSKGWNGKFNRQMQPSQTYIWTCEYKIQGSLQRINQKGMVTLIR